MFWLFESVQFIKWDGSFNPKEFHKLLVKSRNAIKDWRKWSVIQKKSAFEAEIMIGGISRKEVWQFINKLSNFVNSWVDIKTGCGIVEKQLKNARLRKIVGEMRSNLDYGLSLSETLKQYEKYFDPLVISTIEIGEKTGNLPKVLTELEASMLEQIEIQSKIRGAMIYPVILMFLAFVMVIFMLTFVLPKITESFKKGNVELPALTKFLMDTSDFIIAHYILLLIFLFGVGSALYVFSKTYTGQYVLSWLWLRVPVFGFIAKQNNIISFISSMNLLLEAGVLMLQALEIAADVVPNILYKQAIIRIKNEVEVGVKFSVSMKNGVALSGKQSPLFPDDFVHMVWVGEETGTISKNMKKVGETYSKELRRFIGNLMSALEPFIIVFIGAIVGTIVIAIMLPFFKLAEVAKRS